MVTKAGVRPEQILPGGKRRLSCLVSGEAVVRAQGEAISELMFKLDLVFWGVVEAQTGTAVSSGYVGY